MRKAKTLRTAPNGPLKKGVLCGMGVSPMLNVRGFRAVSDTGGTPVPLIQRASSGDRTVGPGGFTMIELILVLTLLTLLAGVFVANMRGFSESSEMIEGVDRFDTLVRMIRAEAANTGRRFRISFDEETYDPFIEWEPEPLAAGGQFVPYTAGHWDNSMPNGLVRVVTCQLVGDSAYRTYDAEAMQTAEGVDCVPITFDSDGTCDSAMVTLGSLYDSDSRVGLVEINGLMGEVTSSVLSEDEYAAWLEQSDAEADGS